MLDILHLVSPSDRGRFPQPLLVMAWLFRFLRLICDLVAINAGRRYNIYINLIYTNLIYTILAAIFHNGIPTIGCSIPTIGRSALTGTDYGEGITEGMGWSTRWKRSQLRRAYNSRPSTW